MAEGTWNSTQLGCSVHFFYQGNLNNLSWHYQARQSGTSEKEKILILVLLARFVTSSYPTTATLYNRKSRKEKNYILSYIHRVHKATKRKGPWHLNKPNHISRQHTWANYILSLPQHAWSNIWRCMTDGGQSRRESTIVCHRRINCPSWLLD